MKILALSDVHIYNYSSMAVFNADGSSNRLLLYLRLAQDIAKIAKEKQVDFIAIAGDLIHAAIADPRVAWVAEQFVRILADVGKPLVITLGQHDCVTKLDADQYHASHSIISPILAEKNNVYLAHKVARYEIDGWSVVAAPWSPNTYLDFEPADIFVGHGAVIGCTDYSGHEYKTGFPKNILWDNFKVSIIGDIHSRQYHQRDNSIIVQPGALHSNKVGDGVDNGIWIIEVDKEKGVQGHEFISNRDFEHSDLYYDFVKYYTEENYPYKIRPKTFFDKLPENKTTDENGVVVEKTATLNLVELFSTVVKAKEQEQLIPLFEELYTETKQVIVGKVPSKSKILRIEAENFMSIAKMDMGFDDWGQLLITGSNGLGKSACIDSIFFTLTGKNTKKLTLDELKRNGTNNYMTSVTLNINGDTVKITRKRVDSVSTMDLIINGTPYQTDSVTNTQKYVLELLGVTEKELLTFCYFSTFEYESFTSMTAKPQYEIISKLAQTEVLDTLRQASLDKTKSISEDLKTQKFYLDRLLADKKSKESSVETLELVSSEEQVSVEQIQQQIEETSARMSSLNNVKASFDKTVSEYNSSIKVKSMLESELDRYKTEGKTLLEKRAKLAAGKCYTCGQKYNSEKEIADIDSKLLGLKALVPSKMEELKNITSKVNGLKETVNQLSSKKLTVEQDITRCKADLQSFNSKIAKATKIALELGKLTQLRESIEQVQRDIESTQDKVSELESLVANYKNLDKILARDGEMVDYLFNNTLNMLNTKLKQLTLNLGFNVKLSFDKELSIKVSGFLDKPMNFNNLSGGQRKLVEIALIGCFLNAYNEIYSLDKGLIGYTFLDEVVSYVDHSNMEKVFTLLSRMESNVVVITHESSLKNEFDKVIEVTMTTEEGSVYTRIK